jgi:hypothetical protein
MRRYLMMRTHLPRGLSQWLSLSLALFVLLACFLLAPAAPESASARTRTSSRRTARQAQSKPAAEPTSAVYGRVVYDETSRPVRRARVMLVAESGNRTDFGGLTDARGDFRINGVSAGTYYAFVDLPGVLSPVGFVSINELRTSNSPDFTEARKFFDVIEVDGKQDTQITVHARRGAALGGKVTYAEGDPAINVTINVMRRGSDGRLAKYVTGANLVSISGMRTDDRGVFRISGLPPGEYIIGVSESVEHGDGGARNRSNDIAGMVEGLMGQQLLMTFYPSATSAKEASAVKVEAGEERADIDIRIPARELRTVSGTVRGRRDKQPVANVKISIVRRDDESGEVGGVDAYLSGEFSHNTTMTDSEGRWQFKEIPDGRYTLVVKPPEEYEKMYETMGDATNRNANLTFTNANVSIGNMNSAYRAPRKKRGYAPTRHDLEVSSGDVSEVDVEVGEGGRIYGSITIEGGGTPRYSFVNALRVTEGGSEFGAADMKNATAEGGQFSIEGLPAGKFFLRASTYDEVGKLYVKSLTWGGRDLMRQPLELAEGASIEGVEVVFAHNPATLRVMATQGTGKTPAVSASIFIIPADVAGWSPYTQQFLCGTDGEGFCSVTVPPGDYRVVALPRSALRGPYEVEVKRRAANALTVSLSAGETKDLHLAAPEK